MGQLFGQTEAPMMISSMAPKDHFHADGSLATERFASAGRPGPLVTVAIMDDQGRLLAAGERGHLKRSNLPPLRHLREFRGQYRNRDWVTQSFRLRHG